MKVNEESSLLNCYTEIRHNDSGITLRARSGLTDGLQNARLELVKYPVDSSRYQSIVVFECTEYCKFETSRRPTHHR